MGGAPVQEYGVVGCWGVGWVDARDERGAWRLIEAPALWGEGGLEGGVWDGLGWGEGWDLLRWCAG